MKKDARDKCGCENIMKRGYKVSSMHYTSP